LGAFTSSGSSGWGFIASQIVSLMSTDSRPISATMSPAAASSAFFRPKPSNT